MNDTLDEIKNYKADTNEVEEEFDAEPVKRTSLGGIIAVIIQGISFTMLLFLFVVQISGEPDASDTGKSDAAVLAQLVQLAPLLDNMSQDLSQLLTQNKQLAEQIKGFDQTVLKRNVSDLLVIVNQINADGEKLAMSLKEHRHNAANQFRNLNKVSSKVIDSVTNAKPQVKDEPVTAAPKETQYRYNFKNISKG